MRLSSVIRRTLGQAAGAACKDIEAQKTRMAAPLSFSRWFADDSLARSFLHVNFATDPRDKMTRVVEAFAKNMINDVECIEDGIMRSVLGVTSRVAQPLNRGQLVTHRREIGVALA